MNMRTLSIWLPILLGVVVGVAGAILHIGALEQRIEDQQVLLGQMHDRINSLEEWARFAGG